MHLQVHENRQAGALFRLKIRQASFAHQFSDQRSDFRLHAREILFERAWSGFSSKVVESPLGRDVSNTRLKALASLLVEAMDFVFLSCAETLQ